MFCPAGGGLAALAALLWLLLGSAPLGSAHAQDVVPRQPAGWDPATELDSADAGVADDVSPSAELGEDAVVPEPPSIGAEVPPAVDAPAPDASRRLDAARIEDADVPTARLYFEMFGEPPEGITLRRGIGEEPIRACEPSCSMTVPRGHYRVRIEGTEIRTAFHLDQDSHTFHITRESRQAVRDLAMLPGVFASASFAAFLVSALLGALVEEVGGSPPTELVLGMAIGGAGLVVFGVPTFAMSALNDHWALEAR